MAYSNITLQKKDGVARLTLNRPQALNALNTTTLTEIGDAMADITQDDAVRAVIITGSGRAFCAGADLKEVQGKLDNPQALEGFLRLWHRVFNSVEDLVKPTIAGVNGFALAGGLELVQVCDLAIASEAAQMGDQHANYGLIAGGGGTQRLPRLMGIRKAKELLLTGDWLTPADAERFGLVNKVVPADKLDETLNELAAKLASKSPMASKAIKALVNKGMQVDLHTGLELEISMSLNHFRTEDVAEGLDAFEKRRPPVFKGR